MARDGWERFDLWGVLQEEDVDPRSYVIDWFDAEGNLLETTNPGQMVRLPVAVAYAAYREL
jgi:hypothetical protein